MLNTVLVTAMDGVTLIRSALQVSIALGPLHNAFMLPSEQLTEDKQFSQQI
jgi:hypothetical protein